MSAYNKNPEEGAINIDLKLARQREGKPFEWPNILELNKLMADYSAGKTVLDIGCGTGATALYMSENAQKVVAIEPDQKTLSWAKQNRSRENIEYLPLYTDDLDSSYDGSFDLITAVDVIEHIEDYYPFISDCTRLLKEDGSLVITSPNRNRDRSPRLKPAYRYHVQEFSSGELYFLFNTFFSRVELYGLRDVYNRKSVIPIDVNSKIHTTIMVCKEMRRRV